MCYWFNAIFENELAAHYALMPLEARHKGKKIKALISINTATGKNHQGRGLFTILAKNICRIKKSRIWIVFGVANANSIPGFIKKLDFKYIDKLDTYVSVTLPKEIDNQILENSLTLPLSKEAYKWRLSNPNFKYSEFNYGKVNIVANDINYFLRSIISIYENNSSIKIIKNHYYQNLIYGLAFLMLMNGMEVHLWVSRYQIL